MVWVIFYNIIFWSITITILWGYWHTLQRGWQSVKQLHRIPCSRCVYFTGNYRLKCTVNPCIALSVEAINCPYFESKENYNGS